MLDRIPYDDHPRLMADIYAQLRAEWDDNPHIRVDKLAAADQLTVSLVKIAGNHHITPQIPLWRSNGQIRGASTRTRPADIRWLTRTIIERVRHTESQTPVEHALQHTIRNAIAASPDSASLVTEIIDLIDHDQIAEAFTVIRGGLCG